MKVHSNHLGLVVQSWVSDNPGLKFRPVLYVEFWSRGMQFKTIDDRVR
jgi:hypothetical protein